MFAQRKDSPAHMAFVKPFFSKKCITHSREKGGQALHEAQGTKDRAGGPLPLPAWLPEASAASALGCPPWPFARGPVILLPGSQSKPQRRPKVWEEGGARGYPLAPPTPPERGGGKFKASASSSRLRQTVTLGSSPPLRRFIAFRQKSCSSSRGRPGSGWPRPAAAAAGTGSS